MNENDIDETIAWRKSMHIYTDHQNMGNMGKHWLGVGLLVDFLQNDIYFHVSSYDDICIMFKLNK